MRGGKQYCQFKHYLRQGGGLMCDHFPSEKCSQHLPPWTAPRAMHNQMSAESRVILVYFTLWVLFFGALFLTIMLAIKAGS